MMTPETDVDIDMAARIENPKVRLMSNHRMLMIIALSFLACTQSGLIAQTEDSSEVIGSSVHCPDVKQLGSYQKMIYESRLDVLFQKISSLMEKGKLDIHITPTLESISILTSAEDSAVCQKLNERFRDVLNQKKYLPEPYDAMYPTIQPAYFKLGEYYFAYLADYTPEPPEGQVPLLSTGGGGLFIFDSNLNVVLTM